MWQNQGLSEKSLKEAMGKGTAHFVDEAGPAH